MKSLTLRSVFYWLLLMAFCLWALVVLIGL